VYVLCDRVHTHAFNHAKILAEDKSPLQLNFLARCPAPRSSDAAEATLLACCDRSTAPRRRLSVGLSPCVYSSDGLARHVSPPCHQPQEIFFAKHWQKLAPPTDGTKKRAREEGDLQFIPVEAGPSQYVLADVEPTGIYGGPCLSGECNHYTADQWRDRQVV
jgi:hypothetical protein